MYSKAIDFLKKNCYGRYEISNFSKQGYECAHNLGYWSQGEYLGFGTGAYSYFDSKRFHIKNDIDAYIESENFSSLMCIDEVLDEQDKVAEFIMLSLRLCKGFSEKELLSRTHNAKLYLKRIQKFISAGLMDKKDGRIFFTQSGFNVSNAVLSEILYD